MNRSIAGLVAAALIAIAACSGSITATPQRSGGASALPGSTDVIGDPGTDLTEEPFPTDDPNDTGAPDFSDGPADTGAFPADTGPTPSPLGTDTSHDAVTWQRVKTTAFNDACLSAVATGPLGNIGVGGSTPDCDATGSPAAWTTDDGFTWTRATVPVNGNQYGLLHAAVESPTRIVAVGETAPREDPNATPPTDPVADVPGSAAVWTSTDGATWTQATSIEGADKSRMFHVVLGGPGFIATGLTGPDDTFVAWASPDGITWKRAPHNAAMDGPGAGDLAAANGTIVAVASTEDGAETSIRVSHDGINWEAAGDVSMFTGSLVQSVTAGGPGFVAVGGSEDRARSWTSPDGLTWTPAPASPELATGGSMHNVVTIPGGIEAVGEDVYGAATWASKDGVSWKREHSPLGQGWILDVAGTSKLFAVGGLDQEEAVSIVWVGTPRQ